MAWRLRRSAHDRRPRRIAFLHDNVAFGGIETLQVEILRHLDPARYTAIVVVGEPLEGSADRLRALLAETSAELLVVPRPDVPVIGGLLGIVRLAGLLRREGVDVSHIQTRTPEASRRLTVAAFLARVPARLRTEHVSPGPHVGRWTRRAVVPFDWMTDVIVTDSRHDRLEQVELVGRAPSKVVHSYCGIDPTAFDSDHDVAAAKVALGIDPATSVVGTVGRLHEQKGHRFLIEAAEMVAGRHTGPLLFLLVGDGPDEEARRQQVRAAGLDDVVRFAGFQTDARPYMQAMDIAVMPSLWEGFSISMQEFMALGTAMVVSDHHSFREAMDHDVHGLIVPRSDGRATGEAILALLADGDRRNRLGAAARQRAVNEFSIQRHTAELMGFYDTVLAGGAVRTAADR